MKYCLSLQVGKEYLVKADEIRITLSQLDNLIEIYELNSNATIILRITGNPDINWTDIENYNTMFKGNFIIETDNLKIIEACKALNLKFYWGVPIDNLYDLRATMDLGSCYAKITGQLIHMMDKVNMYEIGVRVAPNIAYYKNLPRDDGVLGGWIRPEDTEKLEGFVHVYEFEDCDDRKEQALYRIYAEDKKWPGQLNRIITNLDYSGTNRLIPARLADHRYFCQQRCLAGAGCKECYQVLNLADAEKWSFLREKKE